MQIDPSALNHGSSTRTLRACLPREGRIPPQDPGGTAVLFNWEILGEILRGGEAKELPKPSLLGESFRTWESTHRALQVDKNLLNKQRHSFVMER